MSVARRIHVTVALVLFLVLLLPSIAGCIAAPPPPPRGPTGTLVIAQKSMGNERWMPHLASSAVEMAMAGEIYEFLVYRKPGTSELVPGVAERWEMAPDGLTWTFYLRKGIQFHEGWGELTATDINQTYELMVSEKATSSLTPYLRASIKSVEVVNPYQVVFNMKKSTWDLAYRLSTGIAYFGIVSKKYIDSVGIDKAAQRPIGSGSFRYVDSKAGQYLTLEAVENHWRQTPYFKTLTYKPIPEDATRIAMLKTGEADIVEINPDAISDLRKAGLRLVEIPNSKSLGIHFGGIIFPTRPTYDPKVPWADPNQERALKVRKAIALAINKQEIIDYVLMGFAKPLPMQYFFPDMPQADPAWKPYPYDPEQSKKLLTEAGYPSGLDLTILNIAIPGRPELGAIAEAAAMQLGKAGMRVTIRSMELTAYRTLSADRKVGGVLFPMATTRFDEPAMALDTVGVSKAALTWGVEDTKLDELVAKAIGELDYTKRLSLQRQIGQYLLDQHYYIPIASGSTIYAANKKIGEWPLIPNMSLPFYFEYLAPR